MRKNDIKDPRNTNIIYVAGYIGKWQRFHPLATSGDGGLKTHLAATLIPRFN